MSSWLTFLRVLSSKPATSRCLLFPRQNLYILCIIHWRHLAVIIADHHCSASKNVTATCNTTNYITWKEYSVRTYSRFSI
ncbi:hypothetical protein BKA62DRAFT_455738 [Auriculariales sp. MPI-PUGE-AT-0066]|nr:hypothetical protein BKA62DRAFT_455738 [Auriculariales sp. MPI-PUGE-AT-0066]